MTKRNLTLLIIVLIIISTIAFGFLYFYNPSGNTGTGTPGTNFLSNLLPFGKSTTNTSTPTPPADVSGYVPPAVTEVPVQQQNLTKVSTMPIAGFGVFQKERFVEMPVVIPSPTPALPEGEGENTNTTPSPSPTLPKGKGVAKPTPPATEFVPALRYTAKADGKVYETFADAINETQFTTTVIPKVYDAYFANKCQSVAMRYLNDDGKTIETFVGALPKEVLGGDTASDTEIKGSFLPENISDLNVSPDTLSLFYLFIQGDNDSSVGITADSLGGKKVQIFSSPFTEWLSQWPNSRMITLTTKPSAGVPGYMYAVDPNKKDFNKILGNINGLTTLASPSGKLILYSNDNLSLSIYNTDTKNSSPLGLKTLAEKCVWGKLSDTIYCAVPKNIEGSNYPDTWYQGEVSFADNIWKINTADGTTSLISDPASTVGEDIDGIKLALDENQNYLFFINKKDSYLWELNLK